MSLVAKTDNFPAVSLLLVKPAQNQVSDDRPMSRDQLMKMIYMLMLLVGANTSLIQNSFAQNQLEMADVAKNESVVTHTATVQYLKKLDEYNAEVAAAKSWGIFGEAVKYIGAAVGILLGGLLCETPLGFFLLAAVIVFTTTPLFQTVTNALGDVIGKAIGDQTWGRIIAQVIVIIALTDLTAEGEGSFGFGAATVLTQTVLSSNLIGELVIKFVDLVSPHGDENTKKCWEGVVTLLCSLCAAFFSFNTASAGTITATLSTNVKIGVGAFIGISQTSAAAAQGGSGYHTYEQGVIQEELAPIEANVTTGQGLTQILNQITNLSQQTYKSIMESNKILFETDFASDWKSCVDAQQVQG